jgi:hypothetical protein
MSRTFEGDFEHLLKAIREWAEIGNPMGVHTIDC